MKSRIVPRASSTTADPSDDAVIRISKIKLKQMIAEQLHIARDAIYRDITSDVCRQMLSACLWELVQNHGFGEKRLQSVVRGSCSWMQLAPFGKPITATSIMKLLEEKYHIDWDAVQIQAQDPPVTSKSTA